MKSIVDKGKEILKSKSFKKGLSEKINLEKDVINIDEDLTIERDLIEEFVGFCKEYLKITSPIKINLVSKRGPDFGTLAYYMIGESTSFVYCRNRALIDSLRSLAHELTHNQQDLNGVITQDQVSEENDGVDIENDANAQAGVIIRMFGRKHPELYDF